MRSLILAALLAAASPAFAQMAPAAAVSAPDRPADDQKLDAVRKPAEMIAFMGVKPGDKVIDMVAGGGYYTRLLAKVVGPKGAVVATNPQSIVDRHTADWQALRDQNPNVTLRIAGAANAPLPDSSFDEALFHLVYHDLYWESAQYKIPRTDPALQLAALYKAMKTGGTVTVIDHAANPGGETRAVVDKLHRIDPETIKADFVRAGFKLQAESQALRNPSDDHTKLVFDPSIRGNTDRVVYRFVKP